MGRRHFFLSKFEPHEYIIYFKKTNKKLRAGWFERGQKRERERNEFSHKKQLGLPKDRPRGQLSHYQKKKTILVFASHDTKTAPLLYDQLHWGCPYC